MKFKDIFIKFTNLRINIGYKILFYVSKHKILVGEAIISDFEKTTPFTLWEKYSNRIYLDKDDFDNYITFSPVTKEIRKMKKITVFKLDRVKRFKKPIKPTFLITPNGRYLTKKLSKEIQFM